MNKQKDVKYKFIRSNFLLYFCTFTIPIMFLSLILVVRSYLSTGREVNENLNRTVELGMEQLTHYVSVGQGLNMYIENGNQGIYFYQMLRSRDMDYSAVISMRHLSSYLTALKTTNKNIDSVYYYIENPLKRVLTSDNMITTLDIMRDNTWTGQFHDMPSVGWKAVERRIRKSEFEGERGVYSFFFRFNHYYGGTVINYDKKQVQRILDEALAYNNQFFVVRNSESILMSNSAFMGLSDNMEYYLTEMRNLAGYQVFTGVPRSTVYSLIALNVQSIVLMILVSVTSAAGLAYYCAVRNYKQLYGIVTIFDVAAKDMKIEECEEEDKTLYTQILNNIVHTFVENNYLQAQLSRRKYKQIAAQLMALQCQINPHFLFNTLQAINYEVMDLSEGEHSAANSMIENLADILRYSLANPEEKVQLSKEIDNCMKYLEIQQMRQNQFFRVEWMVMNTLLNIRIPRLILQPLVENAVYHGIRGLNNRSIKIQVKRKAEFIIFSVIDNGVGINRGRLKEIELLLEVDSEELSKEHIGIFNTNMRLRLLYGKGSSISIRSKSGMGTIVTFRIPCQETVKGELDTLLPKARPSKGHE